MARHTKSLGCFAVALAVFMVAYAEDKLKVDVISKPEVCDVKSKNGDLLTMHYTGTLADGTKFDSRPLPDGIERTFIMIKPDGVQRGLVGKIITRFEGKGLKLEAIKFLRASECLLHQHYAEHQGKAFFDPLIQYIQSGPVVPMVWQGPDAVKIARSIIGSTNPAQSPPGTIRGDLALQTQKNLIHGSDSVTTAEREIDLWFSKNELIGWDRDGDKWLLESV